MKRRALIIYCDATASGPLPGPAKDYSNYHDFLQTSLGGEWDPGEILGLNNPRVIEVQNAVATFMAGADYTFTIFTGHGWLDGDGKAQLEVLDGDIRIRDLKPMNCPRQTIIIDACREYLIESNIEAEDKFFSKALESTMHIGPTRTLFDNAVLSAPGGLSILYAASENQSAADTKHGAVYLLSLLKSAENWRDSDARNMVLTLKGGHQHAIQYMEENFEETIQAPQMAADKRTTFSPFAVKLISLHS